MSKLALINRQEKREKLVAKYAKKRAMLESIIENPRVSDEDRYAARLKLQGRRRPSAPARCPAARAPERTWRRSRW